MDNSEDIQPADSARNHQEAFSEFDFIKDKPHLVYLIKKIEKISGAVHLVTSQMAAEEPLRLKLREQCLLLLQSCLIRKKRVEDSNLETILAECLLLLSVGEKSLLISQMNASVLRAEFLNLFPVLNEIYLRERAQISFDESELRVALLPSIVPSKSSSSDLKRHSSKENVSYGERTELSTKISSAQDKSKQDKRQNESATKDTQNESGNTRVKMIMDIIRARGEVGIKDISSLIRGVSGKTIQRDLLGLVEKGILKKSGERRWSRYRLTGK